jgi:hypothetical protein
VKGKEKRCIFAAVWSVFMEDNLGSIAYLAKELLESSGSIYQWNEDYFYKFIEPTWDEFETIHTDFKELLAEFRTMLGDGNLSSNDALSKIRIDSDFIEEAEFAWNNVTRYFPQTHLENNNQLVSEFLMQTQVYFSFLVKRFHAITSKENSDVNELIVGFDKLLRSQQEAFEAVL